VRLPGWLHYSLAAAVGVYALVCLVGGVVAVIVGLVTHTSAAIWPGISAAVVGGARLVRATNAAIDGPKEPEPGSIRARAITPGALSEMSDELVGARFWADLASVQSEPGRVAIDVGSLRADQTQLRVMNAGAPQVQGRAARTPVHSLDYDAATKSVVLVCADGSVRIPVSAMLVECIEG